MEFALKKKIWTNDILQSISSEACKYLYTEDILYDLLH